MEPIDYKQILLRECVRALPWGVMLLLVIAISGNWLKQEVKEAVEYSLQTTIAESKQALLDPQVFGPIKRNVKEALEFTAKTTAEQARKELMNAPTFVRIKKNTREAIEYASKTAADEYVRAQRQLK